MRSLGLAAALLATAGGWRASRPPTGSPVGGSRRARPSSRRTAWWRPPAARDPQSASTILEAGGTAVDAAIAANAALGLMEPIELRDRRRPVRDRLGREDKQALRPERAAAASPRGLTLDGVREARASTTDPAARAARRSRVPGASTAGSSCTHASAGCRWRRCSRPRSATRAKGFPVPQVIACYWAARRATRYADYPDFAGHVYLPGGQAPRAGEVFRNPTSPRRYERSPRAAATPSTRARSPSASRRSAAERRLPTLRGPRRAHLDGSSRSRPTTAATTSGSCRRTARASPRCRC